MMLPIILTTFLFLTCSAANNIIAPRIVGGQNTIAGQYPYIAAVHVTTDDSNFFCGGTLVNIRWVITAGQCVYRATLVTIQLGSHYLTTPDPNRVTLASSSFVVHPEFNPDTLENDLGLIHLRMSILINDYLQPIMALPVGHFEPAHVAYAAGWGQINDEQSDLIEHLQYVRVSALSNEECKITFGNQIKDNMLCVAGDYNEGICIGDTGGPLVELMRGNGRLVGIASFISGNGCESTDPSGYVRIFPYVEWIKNVTSNLSGPD